MKTIQTTLPVYNRIEKQCYERAHHAGVGIVPIMTPRYRLPSMQWNVEADDPGYIDDIRLIDTDGAETDLENAMFQNLLVVAGMDNMGNSGYDVFNSASSFQFTAQKTTAAGIAYAYTDTFSVVKNKVIWINYSLTLTSGTAPKLVIVNNAGTDISPIHTMLAGANTIKLTITETATARIRVRNLDTEQCNIGVSLAWFDTALPGLNTELTDEFFIYNGHTLGQLLPTGLYYLKMATLNGYIYYSDWFRVDCIYPNLLTGFDPIYITYNIFTVVDLAVTQASEVPAAAADAQSYAVNIIKGERFRVVFNFTFNSGEYPEFYIVESGIGIRSNIVVIEDGLNDFILTATQTGTFRFMFNQNGTDVADWSATEILIFREYSTKYLTLNFTNSCDLGELIYHDDFTQTLWFESESMETSFPQEEEGQKNNDGKFFRTFTRQVKKYIARTKMMPDFMVDVFNRMKLHNSIELIDLVGDTHDVYNLEVDHEWLFDDKYYAKIDLTFDYNETVLSSGCCVSIE